MRRRALGRSPTASRLPASLGMSTLERSPDSVEFPSPLAEDDPVRRASPFTPAHLLLCGVSLCCRLPASGLGELNTVWPALRLHRLMSRMPPTEARSQ